MARARLRAPVGFPRARMRSSVQARVLVTLTFLTSPPMIPGRRRKVWVARGDHYFHYLRRVGNYPLTVVSAPSLSRKRASVEPCCGVGAIVKLIPASSRAA